MNRKNILIIVIVLILLLVLGNGIYWYMSRDIIGADRQIPSEDIVIDDTDGKIKADVFQGKLEEVNVGCFVDGECYVVVDGKHVTTIMGWSQQIVGSIQGVESIGDLESHIGEDVEVYAQDKGDGSYTLYGSAGFYVKLQ